MRSMSQSVGKPPKIISKLVEKWRAVCLWSPLLAVAYMAVIILPAYNEPTRISENALLPALVTEHFSYHQRIVAFAKALHLEHNRAHYVASQLKHYSIDAYFQSYQITIPNLNVSKSNVYGLVHASRSASVESILVAVAVDESVEAVALTLALATYCREQVYWARNIFFVFVDGGPLGMEAFLAAYYGFSHSHLKFDHIHHQGGTVIGAFVVKTTGLNFNDLNIEYNSMNGQLPNLDLINLFVKLADKFGLTPTIFGSGHQSTWTDIAETVMKGMLTQAFTNVQGIHSIFGSYGIQGVTAHAIGSHGHVSLSSFAKLCEGALRSLNNILERFHQSYFLYILPDSRRFISVAYYMPVIGLLIFPLIVLALREWFSMTAFVLPNSYMVFHMIGLASYFIGSLLAQSYLSNSFYFYLLLLLFPYYLVVPRSRESVAAEKFFFFLETALIIASVSLLNFSLAFYVSLVTVPAVILLSAFDMKKLNWIKGVFGFVAHPLVIFFIFKLTVISPEESIADAISLLNGSLNQAYLLLNNMTVPLLHFCLIPLWSILLHFCSEELS